MEDKLGVIRCEGCLIKIAILSFVQLISLLPLSITIMAHIFIKEEISLEDCRKD